MQTMLRSGRRSRLRVMIALALAACAACSRSAYRQRADREAEQLVAEKNTDPRWQQDDFDVYPDRRARFYDPYNPDRPPMPADDPTSHSIMRRIDGKRQFKRWHKDGVIDDVQNPCWEVLLPTYTETTADGKVKLDLKSAVLLARIHNPEYQDNLEEIYLAALDVAFERFRFDLQFFGGNDTIAATNGNQPFANLGRSTGPTGTRESSATLNTFSTLGFTRRFATGADLLVNFANTFVWQFAGPDTNYATSLLSFSLVQPLLRNGGRAVVLEQLTRAERALLSTLRAQAQFRQQFFKYIAVGGSPTTTPRRIGGFAGGAGLSGFTGTGEGGFGGVGAGQNFGGAIGRAGVGGSGAGGTAGLAGGGEGTVGGYYGMLQQLQAIRNTESSLASQMLTLELLEANFEAGLIDLVQVDEFRQNIETERSNLLRSRVAFRDTVENYLISTLGLPPTLDIELDDSLTRQFQFIDPKLTAIQTRGTEMLRELGNLPPNPAVQTIGQFRDRLIQLLEDGLAEFRLVQNEFRELESRKNEYLARIEDADRKLLFENNLPTMAATLANLSKRVDELRKSILELDPNASGKEKESVDRIVELTRSAANLFEEVSLVQARTRVEQIFVKPIDLDEQTAFLIARENRLDWMNRRSLLVDQWRLITFNANRLRGFLSVNLDGDIGTLKNNAVDFRAKTGNLRASLQFDAPLNRKAERNLYREALISYQRAKRTYITYVDQINLTLRSRLRQVKRLRTNLEIQRRALAIAIRRVDQTLEDLNRPAQAARPGEAPAQLGPTLAQNLLRALSDLRNTQDNFMSVWLNYESARINLMIELGLLRLDDEGMWLDESVDEALARAQAELMQCRPGDACNLFFDEVDHLTMRGDPSVVEMHDPVEHLLDGKDDPACVGTENAPSPGKSFSPGGMKVEVVDEKGQPAPMPSVDGRTLPPPSVRALRDALLNPPQPAAPSAQPPAQPPDHRLPRPPQGEESVENLEEIPAGKSLRPPPKIRHIREYMEQERQKQLKNAAPAETPPASRESRGEPKSALDRIKSWLPGARPSSQENEISREEFVVNLRLVKQLLDEGASEEEIRRRTRIDEVSLKAYSEAARQAGGTAIQKLETETRRVAP